VITSNTSKLSLRPRAICPLCTHDEEVTLKSATANGWIYTCSKGRNHPVPSEPFEFHGSKDLLASKNDGIMARLGLFEDLLHCVKAGEPWVEHAIVEHRFKEQYPNTYFRELLPQYAHRTQNLHKDCGSISRFIGQALVRLEQQGVLVQKKGPGTGCYNHLNLCGYWAISPGPQSDVHLTWAEFATRKGLHPNDWDLTPLATAQGKQLTNR
jgi:hypothetical protein